MLFDFWPHWAPSTKRMESHSFQKPQTTTVNYQKSWTDKTKHVTYTASRNKNTSRVHRVIPQHIPIGEGTNKLHKLEFSSINVSCMYTKQTMEHRDEHNKQITYQATKVDKYNITDMFYTKNLVETQRTKPNNS